MTEIRVIFIPSSPHEKPEVRMVENTLESLQGMVHGFIEVVRRLKVPTALSGRRNLVLVVNEDGLPMNMQWNGRATGLAGQVIVGDCILMAEGRTDEGEMDFVSLPENFTEAWELNSRMREERENT